MFNSKRQLLVDWLFPEYNREDAETQIANANVNHMGGDRYSVLYDNGKADLVSIKGDLVELIENFG